MRVPTYIMPKFDFNKFLQHIQDFKITGLNLAPPIAVKLAKDPLVKQYDLSSVRNAGCGAAPLSHEVAKQVDELWPRGQVNLKQGWGMTETSPISFQSRTDDPLERRVATVGRIHPPVEVKNVDAAGEVVPLGASGELCTRGYSVMRGYWKDRERTAEAIDASGWMHLGALATIDVRGYCRDAAFV